MYFLFIVSQSPLTTCASCGKLNFTDPPPKLRLRGHRFSLTAAAASESGTYLFTAGKEGTIIKWDLSTGSKLHAFHKHRIKKTSQKTKEAGQAKGHTEEVLALAVSGDGRFLASAGRDRKIGVWDVEKNEWLRGFGGHRDTVSVSFITIVVTVCIRDDTFGAGASLSERYEPALHRIARSHP